MVRSVRNPALLCVGLFLVSWSSASEQIEGAAEQIEGPAHPSEWADWLQTQKDFRTEQLASINYNGSIYDVPELQWTKTSYIQPQAHPYDRKFYDPVTHQYTINRFLDDLETRYGGIDSVLVWPVYTSIGMDDRNQDEMIHALPGNLSQMTADFHKRGVKVLWPYMPWDQGAHESGESDEDRAAKTSVITGADGFNGDTMHSVPQTFYDAGVKRDHPMALEPEGGGDLESMNWDTMGWGYWRFPYIPSVDLWKWLEPRRMTNVCQRWAINKTDNLQAAWFNGDGYESWENVWGTWNGIVEQDAEALRRVGHMLRFFGNKGFLQSKDWEPHSPTVQNLNVFASKWPLNNEVVYTLVNRLDTETSGYQLAVDSFAHYVDCYHGVELYPNKVAKGEGRATLSFVIEGNGYGCVFATNDTIASVDGLATFMGEMSNMTKLPLILYDKTWHYSMQEMVPIDSTPVPAAKPDGMQAIPAGNFTFSVRGVEDEGDDAHGVDVQFPWEAHPQREHNQLLEMKPFFMDQYPVTNKDYSVYLQDSSYTPRDDYHFLKNWVNGTYPSGWGNKPVTYVSITEARDYCAFYKKRLPHEYEWQYAAQGSDGRKYPWGNTKDQSCFPVMSTGHTLEPGPADVDAFHCDSPFGVSDLAGNVWQYTDAFQDDHTRSVIVRGSGYYRPSGSHWYFPSAMELDTHNKYFLMDDSYERAGTLGFRCVVDTDACAGLPLGCAVEGRSKMSH